MEREAAQAALEYIRDGMTIALGSGRAIDYLIEFISMGHYKNLKITTNSLKTALEATKRDLNVVPCEVVREVDYAFESADAIFKDGSAIKQGLGAFVENKILAAMAKHFILIVDKANTVDYLTDAYPVQLEVVKPAISYVGYRLEEMDALDVILPDGSEPRVSPSGNYVISASFKMVEDLKKLEEALVSIPGVICTSILADLYTLALVYSPDGVETVEKVSE